MRTFESTDGELGGMSGVRVAAPSLLKKLCVFRTTDLDGIGPMPYLAHDFEFKGLLHHPSLLRASDRSQISKAVREMNRVKGNYLPPQL